MIYVYFAVEPQPVEGAKDEVLNKKPIIDGIDESKLKEADEEWEKDLKFIQPSKLSLVVRQDNSIFHFPFFLSSLQVN